MAAQGGDGEAAGELYRRTRGRARRAALAFCRDVDADDAVAEGLWRALRRIDQLQDPAAVESWMIRSAARAALDLARTQLRVAPAGDVDGLGPLALPAGQSAADEAMADIEQAAMAAALGALAPGPRRLLYLRYEAGLSVNHIASALGRPAGTVRRQCVEARRAAAEQFLGRHLRPAVGSCRQVSDLLCREPYRRPSPRARRLTADHLRRCPPCRDRQLELAAILSELGYRRP